MVCLFHFYFHLFFNFISFLSVIIMFVCLERNVLHLPFLYICIFKDIIYIVTVFRLILLLCVVYTISLIHLYMHQMKPKCSFFSSLVLKAQVSFSDHLSSVVCLSVCLSVRLSVNFSHFHLLLQNHWANFNQTWHKASLGSGNSMKGPALFQGEIITK